MNTNKNIIPGTSGAGATTTEELIVQYLDGELVRKELETVLFDRLSRSEDARTLLREYLVVRGAIRMSREHQQFQLSEDLDERTRVRIQQMMETLVTEETADTTVVVQSGMGGFLEDRAALASSPLTRVTNRRTLRTSLAVLTLLIAVGTTWFVTRQTDDHHTVVASTLQYGATSPDKAITPGPAEASVIPGSAIFEAATPMTATHPIIRQHPALNANAAMPDHLAQNSQTPQDPNVAKSAPVSNAPDPADVMLSGRFAKAIDAGSKHEVVVSSKDRL